ncbi:MAG TPA: cellulose biosynthesis cyclic di-GMP-binding regulatory protein BcsB, partial [Methylomirabilota bacterium]|nr:cellulose biosynthesis cyclic di-GMP-binding regulatory protein BcsB [Methylomirabilota bacterium]
TLAFHRQRPDGAAPSAYPPWEIRREEARLTLAARQLPLFPELRRFPESFAEELLLLPESASNAAPIITLLLPDQPTDAHLRTCVILGARFGQLGYVQGQHLALASTETWREATRDRHAIVLGLTNQFTGLPLPGPVRRHLADLNPGQGLLAEWIEEGPRPRRWLLVAGADGAGLEKAALTLGSAKALTALTDNPAVVTAPPAPPSEEPPAPLHLPAIGQEPITLRGLHRVERSVRGWRFPPGATLQFDGVLNLRLSHSPVLRPESTLEVHVNGEAVGRIALAPGNTGVVSRPLALPRELRGADPTIVTFRAWMDVDPARCDQHPDEDAWVTISQGSTAQVRVEPVELMTLNDLNRALLRDPYLRGCAFLLSSRAPLGELHFLVELAMYLGRQVPGVPSLWPEVAAYVPGREPTVGRLRGRTTLVLCPVQQWPHGLPAGLEPVIEMSPGQSSVVRMQGRRARVERYEPSLAFAQLLDSPWSPGDKVVLAGGWQWFSSPGMRRLLFDPDTPGKLPGDLGAIDGEGRAVGYNIRDVAADSFAERLRRRMPLGLNAAETDHRTKVSRAWSEASLAFNHRMSQVCGGVVLLLVLARLALVLPGRMLGTTASRRSGGKP